ncbi:MAG TPA: hypothetical protein VHY37_05550, partial [Tepidisphaeraceae bacterium]|nr:hypothetical protein [Tepidisphaeraceae bacterium]
KILAALPPFVTPVGLFVDADAAEIRAVAGQLGLRHVQLHGNESPQTIADLRPLTVLKALPARPASLINDMAHWRDAIAQLGLSHLRGLILESPPSPTSETGGTGVANDWHAIAAAQRAGAFEGLPPTIAAGGLTPENVADVIRLLRPWAVDVSSGVEQAKREKSKGRIADFLAAVRDADES